MEAHLKIVELEKRLNHITARDMMTREVVTATEEMPMADLAEKMLRHKISGLPVVDAAEKVIGIITATDLFMLMNMLKTGKVQEGDAREVCNPTVGFAMSREVLSVHEGTTLNEMVNIMNGRNIHTLPVMRGEQLVGIIGRRDVFKHFYAIVKELCRA